MASLFAFLFYFILLLELCNAKVNRCWSGYYSYDNTAGTLALSLTMTNCLSNTTDYCIVLFSS